MSEPPVFIDDTLEPCWPCVAAGAKKAKILKFDPTRDLPDDTPIRDVRLPIRILNALSYVGVQTVGEISETSDANLRSIPKLGPTTVRWLRDNL